MQFDKAFGGPVSWLNLAIIPHWKNCPQAKLEKRIKTRKTSHSHVIWSYVLQPLSGWLFPLTAENSNYLTVKVVKWSTPSTDPLSDLSNDICQMEKLPNRRSNQLANYLICQCLVLFGPVFKWKNYFHENVAFLEVVENRRPTPVEKYFYFFAEKHLSITKHTILPKKLDIQAKCFFLRFCDDEDFQRGFQNFWQTLFYQCWPFFVTKAKQERK